MSFFVDLTLPQGALLPKAAGYTDAFRGLNALWLCADAPLVLETDGVIDAVKLRCGGAVVAPTKANEFGAIFQKDALIFSTGEHRGLWVENALNDSATFMAAVVFRTDGAAKTLVTLNPQDGESYLFLSEEDGIVTLKDQKSTFELSVPLGSSKTHLAIVSFENGQMVLSVDETESHVNADDFEGPSDLFIGCRSHRAGILKTLGQSEICDVFLLDKPSAEAKALITRYWVEVMCDA